MAKTLYQVENAEFSNTCHELAKIKLYPQLFGVDQSNIVYEENTLLHESDKGKILDGEMGVDLGGRRIIKKKIGHTTFTIQERFRRAHYHTYKDITVTEWNYASNKPSELSKINAGIFVYGYANSSVTDFIEVMAINTTDLILAVTNGNIDYDRRRNKKNQSFLTFTFDELLRRNAILYQYPTHWRPPDTKYTRSNN